MESPSVQETPTPYIHLGIIPDGNRRWCKRNNKNMFEYGAMARNMIKNVMDDYINKKTYPSLLLLSEISIYILSRDNLKRQDKTIDLIHKTIDACKTLFSIPAYGELIKLSIHGDISLLSVEIQDLIQECMSYCKGTFPIHLAIAYDPLEDSRLYLEEVKAGNPRTQIDLVVRSGGELRSSGFFPLQTLYSEWVYIDDLWPDMKQEHLQKSIELFLQRKRNFGK